MLRELSPLHRELRHAIPNVYKGFGELSKAAFEPGALDRKTEELQGVFRCRHRTGSAAVGSITLYTP